MVGLKLIGVRVWKLFEVNLALNKEKFCLYFLMMVWIIMEVIVQPVGEFPLNDDWAYAACVRTLIEQGRFVFPNWSASNFVVHAWWGWLFASLLGPSYTVLRFSIWVLGFLGVLAVFKLSKESGGSILSALVCALIFVVNPMYFASSNTFMTDVSFFSFSALALLYLSRAVNSDNTAHLLLGALILGLSLLIRQLGFALAMAYAAAYWCGRPTCQRTLIRAFLPLLVCMVLQLSLNLWLHSQEQLPAMYGYQIKQIKQVLALPLPSVLSLYGSHIFYTLLYLGFFAVPVLLPIFFYSRPKIAFTRVAATILGVALLWWALRSAGVPQWPLLGNIMGKYGIGPLLQAGSYAFQPAVSAAKCNLFWEAIGVFALLSTGLLFYVLFQLMQSAWRATRNKDFSQARLLVLFVGATMIYCAAIVGVEVLFDRYLLLPLLLVIQTVLLAGKLVPASLFPLAKTRPDLGFKCLKVALIIFMLLPAGVLTVAATHDYLSWNRVRWAALQDLIKQGISPARIDGGFEFNGSFLFSKEQLVSGTNGWWVIDNEYMIAFTVGHIVFLKSYTLLNRYEVPVYLPVSPADIFVLRRK